MKLFALLPLLPLLAVAAESHGEEAAAGGGGASKCQDPEQLAAAEAAYIAGYPTLMMYGAIQATVNATSSEEPLLCEARVYGPNDTSVVTPNSDTPYCRAVVDLSVQPVAVCVPEVKDRYVSVQIVDLLSYNVAYLGSRASNGTGGCLLLSGPSSPVPESAPESASSLGVAAVGTDLVFAIFRTQLFGKEDLGAVAEVQGALNVTPLASIGNGPAPAQLARTDGPAWDDQLAQGAQWAAFLNHLLAKVPSGLPPTSPTADDAPGLYRRAGVGPGLHGLQDGECMRQAAVKGLATIANASLGAVTETGWAVSPGGGDEAFYRSKGAAANLYRAALAFNGLFANDLAEASYPIAFVSEDGEALTGSLDYTLTFKAGGLPPAAAFWSLTMYDLETRLLVANPAERFLVNSAMQLTTGADGATTVYIQPEAPRDADKAPNWLPSPKGERFYVVLRMYLPTDAAYVPPAIVPASKQA